MQSLILSEKQNPKHSCNKEVSPGKIFTRKKKKWKSIQVTTHSAEMKEREN